MTQDDEEKREKLTDILDIASESEGKFRDNAISEARAKVKQDQLPDKDGVYAVLDCVECGEEIGEGRLRAAPKNTICIHCASAAERRR